MKLSAEVIMKLHEAYMKAISAYADIIPVNVLNEYYFQFVELINSEDGVYYERGIVEINNTVYNLNRIIKRI